MFVVSTMMYSWSQTTTVGYRPSTIFRLNAVTLQSFERETHLCQRRYASCAAKLRKCIQCPLTKKFIRREEAQEKEFTLPTL